MRGCSRELTEEAGLSTTGDFAPVLVTGSHRSGTTWVGRMLAAGGQLGYVHEPFNVGFGASWLAPRPRHWFLYVCDENEHELLEPMRRVLRFRYPLTARWLERRGLRGLAGVRKQFWLSLRYRLRRLTPLLKDPIALFSTPWLVRRFGVRPVLVVRHPAAFVASLKHLDWEFRFNQLHEQPLLIRDLLYPYADDIARYTRDRQDPVEQAILAWRVFYGTVARFAESNSDWLVLRHEDLALAPDREFNRLYTRLGLDYNESASRAVAEHSRTGNPYDLPREQLQSITRDSRQTLRVWRTRLTPAEVERVRVATADVAGCFYDSQIWEDDAGG